MTYKKQHRRTVDKVENVQTLSRVSVKPPAGWTEDAVRKELRRMKREYDDRRMAEWRADWKLLQPVVETRFDRRGPIQGPTPSRPKHPSRSPSTQEPLPPKGA
jgi:hypothetical protein